MTDIKQQNINNFITSWAVDVIRTAYCISTALEVMKLCFCCFVSRNDVPYTLL